MKLKRKLKRIFNPYSIAIVACIIVILVSGYMLLAPDNKMVTSEGIEIVQSGLKGSDEITEEKAKKTAIKQFEELGEKVNEEEIEIMKVQRSGQEYYYVSSAENSLEIRIKGGKIERINSVLLQEK